MSDPIDPRDCAPNSPFRPPSWRYHRTRHLIEEGRAPEPGFDDGLTRLAWPYFAGSPANDGAGPERLAQSHPAVDEAFAFYTGAEPIRRAELEARILAGQTDDEIAAKLGLSAAGVAAYEALFYDVRRSLTADTYIVNCVIGPKVHYGITPEDHELLLKVYGYALGPIFLDVLLDYFRDPPVVPDSLDGLDHEALRKLVLKLRIKFDILVLTTPASALSPVEWARLREQHSSAPRQGQAGPGGEADVVTSARATLDLLATLSTALSGKAA